MGISELKKDARLELVGKWPIAICINFLHLAVTVALTYVANQIEGTIGLILALVFGILTIPLSFGLSASMLKLSRNEEVKAVDFIKIGFKNFKRAIFLSLSVFVRILVPTLLIAFAGAFSIISGFVESAEALSLVCVLVAVGATIWLMYKILGYALSTYILIDNEDFKSKDAISKSRELMKGNKLKFVGLVFSFIGWFFLCGFLSAMAEIVNVTFGTVVMYALSILLAPYITFAEINFYEDLAGVSEVKVTEETSENPDEPIA